MERLRGHFDAIQLTDIGSAETSKAQENIVVEDDNLNNVDVAPDKVHQDECDENVNTSSQPPEKSEQTSPPKGDFRKLNLCIKAPLLSALVM